jgi:L-2-hydroxycarboxylate dehydrogenase (NAD+)
MTTEAPVCMDADLLEEFMKDVFVGLGVPPGDAAVCAEVLSCADRRGIDSHGVNRLKLIYYDRIKAGILKPVTTFEIVRETATTAVVDGHNGMGHTIARRGMQTAIDKARESGMAMVVVRNSTHFGIAGYYVLMATEADMIGICGTNARPSIAPTFGVENMLGTNPLTFGFPTDEEFPYVLDCATSISQRGRIEAYERLGKDTPSGWVIDRHGNTLTDTSKILEDLVNGEAALMPLGGPGEEMGGHKGYGYATVVEILSTALQSANSMKALSGYDGDGNRKAIELGHFFMAFNIEAFCAPADFRRRTGDMLRALRASERAPGHDRIYTAGEKEHEAWIARKETGIPLPRGVREDMVAMRDELGLDKDRFPWE